MKKQTKKLYIQLLCLHYNVQTRFCVQVSFLKFLLKLVSTTLISGCKLSILQSLLVIWLLRLYVLLNSQDVGLAAGTGDEGYFVPPVKGTSQSQVITNLVRRYRIWRWLATGAGSKLMYTILANSLSSAPFTKFFLNLS